MSTKCLANKARLYFHEKEEPIAILRKHFQVDVIRNIIATARNCMKNRLNES